MVPNALSAVKQSGERERKLLYQCGMGGGSVYRLSVHAISDNSYLVDPASGICLSQGLSHASVSMSELYNETANGSVKQL